MSYSRYAHGAPSSWWYAHTDCLISFSLQTAGAGPPLADDKVRLLIEFFYLGILRWLVLEHHSWMKWNMRITFCFEFKWNMRHNKIVYIVRLCTVWVIWVMMWKQCINLLNSSVCWYCFVDILPASVMGKLYILGIYNVFTNFSVCSMVLSQNIDQHRFGSNQGSQISCLHCSLLLHSHIISLSTCSCAFSS